MDILEPLSELLRQMKGPLVEQSVMEKLVEQLEGCMDFQEKLKQKELKNIDIEEMDDQ